MRSEGGLLGVPNSGFSPRVVACGLDRQHRARLLDALKRAARLEFVESFDDLIHALRRSVEPVDVVVVPSHDTRGVSAERTVRLIAAERPRVAIVAYCRPVQQYSADIRALTAAGVHEFVLIGISDEGAALRDAVSRARRHCAAEWLIHQLGPIIPAQLHPLVEAILAHPDRVTEIRSLADELRVHRKTLFNWCRRARFVPPAELLAWCRLLLVAYHLDNTGCNIETIAIEVSYPSDTTLRNTMKRYTGVTATAARERGAIATVIAAFRRRIA